MYGKYPPYLILSSRHFGSSLRGLLLNVHPLRAQPSFFRIIEHVWQIPESLDTFFQTQPFLSHLSSLPKEHSLFVGCIVGSSVGDTVGGSVVGALVDGLLVENDGFLVENLGLSSLPIFSTSRFSSFRTLWFCTLTTFRVVLTTLRGSLSSASHKASMVHIRRITFIIVSNIGFRSVFEFLWNLKVMSRVVIRVLA